MKIKNEKIVQDYKINGKKCARKNMTNLILEHWIKNLLS